MQRFSIPALAILATASSLSAQTFTSPRGFATTEGDAAHFVIFNQSYERFMQVDGTQIGAVANIDALTLRRDGELVSPTGGSRTLDLTIFMGHGDLSTVSSTFANNYVATPTTVFTRKPVNTPDWSLLSGSPAPFDFRGAFDFPFSFNGNDDLVFELHMENVSQFGSPNVDREIGSSGSFNQSFGTSTFDGCVVSGHGLPMVHTLLMQNYGPNHPQFALRFGFTLQRGPVNQPAVVNFDVIDQNLSFPGLCTTIHALPGINIGLGMTSAVGTLDLSFVDLPYLGSVVVGRRFYTQIVALDPNQVQLPISLSDARTGRFPDDPRPSPAAAYLYAPTTTTPSATLWQDRAIVVQFEH